MFFIFYSFCYSRISVNGSNYDFVPVDMSDMRVRS